MKQIKNYRYSLLFAGALLFASGVANAENSHQLNDEADSNIVEFDKSTCKIRDRNGDSKFRARGDCTEVAAAYKIWKEAQQ